MNERRGREGGRRDEVGESGNKERVKEGGGGGGEGGRGERWRNVTIVLYTCSHLHIQHWDQHPA